MRLKQHLAGEHVVYSSWAASPQLACMRTSRTARWSTDSGTMATLVHVKYLQTLQLAKVAGQG